MANAEIKLHSESTGLVIVDMQVEGCERHGPGMKPVSPISAASSIASARSTERLFMYNRFAPRTILNSPSSGGPMAY